MRSVWRPIRDATPTCHASLGDLITQSLEGRSGFLTFPAALERRYEQDTEIVRRRTFRLTTLFALAVYLANLPIYTTILPDEAGRFILAQLGVATPFVLGCVALIARPCSKVVREAIFSTIAPVCLFALIWSYQGSHADVAANMRYMPIPAMVYCNVVLGLRFPYAVLATAAMVVVNIVDCANAAISPAFRLHAWTLVVFVGVFTLIGAWRMEREARRTYLLTLRERLRGNALGDANRQLRALSMLDPLTGLANRRGLESALAAEWDAARGDRTPVSLLMIDVDCFKLYNDRFGHAAGDDCLRQVASAMHAELRLGRDTLARYGGEEFVAIIPAADPAGCLALAERMRRAIEQIGLPHPDARPGVVTISVGGASTSDVSAIGAGALLDLADRALYAAKQSGRNNVRLDPDRQPVPACVAE